MRLTSTLLALTLLAATAVGQATPKNGDIVLSCFGPSDVVVLDPNTNQTATLLNFPWISPIDHVFMDRGNERLLWVLGGSAANRDIKPWDPVTGPSTKLLPSVPRGIGHAGGAVDIDGGLLLAVNGRLHKGVNGITTTLYSGGAPSTGRVVVDGDDGSYVLVSSANGGSLLRVDRDSLQVATFARNLGNLTDVDFDQRTGTYWVTNSNAFVKRVGRNGGVAIQFGPTTGQAVRVDQATGNIYVASASSVFLISPAGQTIRTWSGAASFITGLDIYGSYGLSPAGENLPMTAGSSFPMTLKLPDSPSANYWVVASLSGMRPGIDLGAGQKLNLVADTLFFLTAAGLIPTVTQNFIGTLDPSGSASPTLNIPAGLPSGLGISMAAIAINNSKPGGVDLSDTLQIFLN